MKVIFVCGPYRSMTVHGIVANIREAEAWAIQLWQAGAAVICPHKNTSLLDGVCHDSVFLKGGIEILKRCDAIAVIPGWLASVGSCAEREYAHQNGIPIFHVWEKDQWDLLLLFLLDEEKGRE